MYSQLAMFFFKKNYKNLKKFKNLNTQNFRQLLKFSKNGLHCSRSCVSKHLNESAFS